jgi:hypothetical protein
MARNNIWVTHQENAGWAVKREHVDSPLSVHDTQQAAIDAGTQLAKQEQAELIWQGKDGQIQGRNSYGNDPRGRG